MAERLLPRLIRLGLSVLAGLLLCVSFPPMGWWWAAVPALALLTWVLVHPGTTMAGGFGYGLLFGLAFYLPLLPWIGGLVGAVPWILLSLMEALFPAVFGLFAVLVARLPGWPLWLACLWSMQEWLKSSVPFGGFPWGVTAFSQTNGPFLVLAQWAGAPLVSFAVMLLATSLCALVLEIARRVDDARHHRHADRHLHLMVPAVCVCAVLLATALAAPACAAPPRPSATNPPSPSPRSRATCRGWVWTSTASVVLSWTTTSRRHCSWPRTSKPAGCHSRSS